ncbi:MAG: hypothetical protein WC728_07820 [Elusimicrobiota bacterium]
MRYALIPGEQQCTSGPSRVRLTLAKSKKVPGAYMGDWISMEMPDDNLDLKQMGAVVQIHEDGGAAGRADLGALNKVGGMEGTALLKLGKKESALTIRHKSWMLVREDVCQAAQKPSSMRRCPPWGCSGPRPQAFFSFMALMYVARRLLKVPLPLPEHRLLDRGGPDAPGRQPDAWGACWLRWDARTRPWACTTRPWPGRRKGSCGACCARSGTSSRGAAPRTS